MKKLATLLICLSLCWPAAISAADTAAVMLSNPGTDKKTFVSIVFPKGTAWEKGDLITIKFEANESSAINLPAPDCLYSPESQRRFNPGANFAQNCKDNPYPSMIAKMYKLSMDEDFSAEWPKDMQDSWIPGFIMPTMPTDIEKAKARFSSLLGLITVGGIQCKPEKGCKLISTASAREITVSVQQPLDMMHSMVVSIPDSFGLLCPYNQGSYEIKVESKVSASSSIEIVKPEVSSPKLSISPEFPGEPSKWTFEFNLSKAGALNTNSSITLKMPVGFAKLQNSYPEFEISVNGTLVHKTNIRLNTGTESDLLIFLCPKPIDRSTKVIMEMSALNLDEGEYSCILSTTSDSDPVNFGPATIRFVQGSTLSETIAGLATDITARLRSKGHSAGESVMILLPSEINEKCQVAINGKTVERPTLGKKTAQFELPEAIPSGSICRIFMSNVTNPLSGDTIKVTIGSSSYEIPWNVSPYQSRLSINTFPPVANKLCSYYFRITPPPDLLEEERKQIIIEGAWNRIIRPKTNSVTVYVRETPLKADFSDKGVLTINIDEPFPNMKPLLVEIPQSSGFGSPDSSSGFTATISGKQIEATCNVQPGPPAVSYEVTSASGKDMSEVENGWFNEPVKLSVFTSSGKSNIILSGLTEDIKSEKSDLETTFSDSIVARDIKAIVSDVGGITEIFLPIIKIDLSELTVKVTNPFEKTGICPTQNLIIGVETIRKTIPMGKEFMVVDPEISVFVNGVQESSKNFLSRIESEKPDSKYSTDISVILKYSTNDVVVRVTDQTGRFVESSFSIKLSIKPIKLELEGSQNMIVDPGLEREIVFVTDPETQVFLGEHTYKADASGKIHAKLDINPGYNIFLTQLITKENVSYEMQIYIIGRRQIRMKSGQKYMTVDGKKVNLKVAPTTITYKFKQGGKGNETINVAVSYVPLRVLAENLFSTVSYNSATQVATIIQKRPDNEQKIELTVNATWALVNGETVQINKDYPIPAIIKDGNFMLPLRFASEQLGSLVGYDSNTKEITITWPDEKNPDNKTGTIPGTGKKP